MSMSEKEVKLALKRLEKEGMVQIEDEYVKLTNKGMVESVLKDILAKKENT